ALVVVHEPTFCRHALYRPHLLQPGALRGPQRGDAGQALVLAVHAEQRHPGGRLVVRTSTAIRSALADPAGDRRAPCPYRSPCPGQPRARRGGRDVTAGSLEQAVVSAGQLSKWYGQVIGLNDVTLTIRPGVTGLLGPNGAGKSTLMKLVAGMLKPSKGS